MGKRTAIPWCDHTHNLWWGCHHAPAEPDAEIDDISEECRHCYAQAFDRRVGGNHWGLDAPRRFFGDRYWAKPLGWNAAAQRAGRRARVFCASQADWAERHQDAAIDARMRAERFRLWNLIRATRWLDWLLLTKRAERLGELLPWMNLATDPPRPLCRDCADLGPMCPSDGLPCDPREPWPNVWVGVTAGTRRSLWRVRALRKVRAAVRFVSAEPLLEHITASDWDDVLAGGTIHWLIVGDESGAGRRPAQPDWIRTAREAAARHRVAFLFKQWAGADTAGISGVRKAANGKIHLPILDGRHHSAFPKVPRG